MDRVTSLIGMRNLTLALAAAAATLVAATAIVAYRQLIGPDSAAVNDVASRLDQRLRASFPATYAGLVPDADDPLIVIYRKPDAALDRYARDGAGEVRVEFRDAKNSLTELATLARRIDDDRPYWRTQGIQMDLVWPRVDGSAVGVTLSHGDMAALERALRERYDDDRIVVTRDGNTAPIN
ncbi:hypothetical protein K1W54_18065 [Micromonospora sp. CPCC 205371]|nr:hypothetical protein [Micromonospora sp. CPCC 205371]